MHAWPLPSIRPTAKMLRINDWRNPGVVVHIASQMHTRILLRISAGELQENTEIRNLIINIIQLLCKLLGFLGNRTTYSPLW